MGFVTGPSTGMPDSGSMVQDAAGNTYLAGTIFSYGGGTPATIDLDPANSAVDDPAIVSVSDGRRVFVAKYDAAGQFQWVRTIHGENDVSIYVDRARLGLASSGGVYIAADYNVGTRPVLVQMGDKSIGNSGDGHYDRLFGRVNADGTVAWLAGFDDGQEGPDFGYPSLSLAVDEAHGRLYAAGSEADNPNGYHHGIVVAINIPTSSTPTPTVAWKAPLVGDYAIPRDVDVDSSGSVYVVGHFSGTTDFDPSSKTLSVSPGLSSEAGFVWKLNSAGQVGWAKAFTGRNSSSSTPTQVSIDPTGNVLVAGDFGGTIDFDPGKSKAERTSGSGADGFLVKLTSSGNFAFVTQFAGNPGAMTLDSVGNIYVLSTEIVAKFNNNGQLQWSQNLAGNLSGGIVVSQTTGQIQVYGRYLGTLNADSDPDPELSTGDDTWDYFWLTYDPLT